MNGEADGDGVLAESADSDGNMPPNARVEDMSGGNYSRMPAPTPGSGTSDASVAVPAHADTVPRQATWLLAPATKAAMCSAAVCNPVDWDDDEIDLDSPAVDAPRDPAAGRPSQVVLSMFGEGAIESHL